MCLSVFKRGFVSVNFKWSLYHVFNIVFTGFDGDDDDGDDDGDGDYDGGLSVCMSACLFVCFLLSLEK